MTRAIVPTLLVILLGVQPLAAQVYARDVAGFEAAAGPLVVQDFEGMSAGTDITNLSIGGIHFDNGDGDSLIVVVADDTYSSGAGGPEHRLIATTPINVLSPGGVELTYEGELQNDDLLLSFSPPVEAFGLDFLWQSADYNAGTSIVVYDQEGLPIFNGVPEITDLGGAGAPAGTDFWGIVSSGRPIASVHIDEQDEGAGNPDSNIGFDTIKISAPTGVHEEDESRSWGATKALYR